MPIGKIQIKIRNATKIEIKNQLYLLNKKLNNLTTNIIIVGNDYLI